MIALIRRDPALRSLPRWLLIAPLFASMMEGLRTLSYFSAVAEDAGVVGSQALLLAASLWLPLSLFLIFGRVGQRCGRLDLGLPIPARQLWQAHVVACLLAGLAIVLSQMMVIWLRRLLVSGISPRIAESYLSTSAPLAAVLATLTLGVLILQIPDRVLYVVQPGRSRLLTGLALVGGGLLAVVLLAALPWYAPLIALAGAALLAALLQRDLPAGFAMIPRQAFPGARLAATRPAAAAARSRPLWMARPGLTGTLGRALMVLRIYTGGIAPGQLFKVPATLLGIPVIFAWGLLLSGLIVGPELSFMFLTLTSYILFAFLPAQASQVYLLDALPISRRSLFAGLILPGLALLGAGYVTGAAVKARRDPAPLVEYQAAGSRYFPGGKHQEAIVRVPYMATRVIWSGQAPLLRSPWGESHPAWSAALFKGGTLGIYSPYATPEPASPEFRALMISRAMGDLYGATIPPDEIQQRYLESNDGAMNLERHTSTLLAEYPQLPASHIAPPAPIYFLVASVFLLLMVGIYTGALRANVSDLGRKVAMFSLLGAIFALHVLQMTLAIAGVLEIEVLGSMLHLGSLGLVKLLPGGTAGLWLVCLALALPVYLWAENRFRRIEAPMGPLSCAGGEAL